MLKEADQCKFPAILSPEQILIQSRCIGIFDR
jgi:hypothetical protein